MTISLKDQKAVTVEETLLTLVQLEQKIRGAKNLQEWQFICLNDTQLLVPFQQSVLWMFGSKKVEGASGLVDVDSNAPFCSWLNRVLSGIAKTEKADRIHAIEVADLSPEDAKQGSEYFSTRFIWLPIKSAKGDLIGALLLSRSTPLNLRDKKLLGFLLEAYGHAWIGLTGAKKPKGQRKKSALWWLLGLLATIGVLSLPVQQSVIAPADIVPQQPSVLRAPIEGVISELLVKPNEQVKQGQLVAKLDAQALTQELESAHQTYVVTGAELRMAQQQSFIDEQRKATLAILEGKLLQAKSDMNYLQDQLRRTEFRAPHSGVAIFDDAGDWLGKPMTLGEPLMTIANPDEIELEVRLPLEDVIGITAGSSVKYFLDSNPSAPIKAQVRSIDYQARPTQDGQYALHLTAVFVNDNATLRLGKKGLAKLYGEQTSLFYYVFRKPLTKLRIWLSW
ncbi:MULTISPECIES: efflux RND transporter periplasmic adaptor subunit [Marinomonas]|uniref:Biotin/lipoyl-binding protein n=1 Tax=Marinomonas rhizomae TaxID=491948 RepID=A0A366JA03_9GAMM|nr:MULTISPECIES: HlyD family efflux transporter periplasmic adaptor subunit [Marinomonas]RBP83866.1 biotin/lipoyl-binding protein [Marinomonas rhizomae]RNF73428.1 HlyD family efflux transporter periplasmic adaptor subunit [Marinomonas rhizomae]WCN11194.1 HlyD family efflux transporter periplasmic adaptor subunit [Marinomonas mediterranea]WCN15256.1 HlyD family efflux transporter periplasmic adaptor subunit [Marinomonas mediterranea]